MVHRLCRISLLQELALTLHLLFASQAVNHFLRINMMTSYVDYFFIYSQNDHSTVVGLSETEIKLMTIKQRSDALGSSGHHKKVFTHRTLNASQLKGFCRKESVCMLYHSHLIPVITDIAVTSNLGSLAELSNWPLGLVHAISASEQVLCVSDSGN